MTLAQWIAELRALSDDIAHLRTSSLIDGSRIRALRHDSWDHVPRLAGDLRLLWEHLDQYERSGDLPAALLKRR